jgi:hypothetical protein
MSAVATNVRQNKPATNAITASWAIGSWPAHIYPHEPGKARYLIRAHRIELLEAGALSSVGREIVVLGNRYQKWLEKQAVRIPGYAAPTRDRILE